MNAVTDFLARVGRFGLYLSRMLVAFPGVWRYRRICIQEMMEVGNRSVLLVILTSCFAATSLTLHGFVTFRRFGSQDLVGVFVAMATIREMGPVLAGAMAGAKYGASATSTLANMVLKEQVDALEVMSVEPYQYLILPRVIASILMTPFLVLIANSLSMICGALFASRVLDVSGGTFWGQAENFIALRDLQIGMIKGAIFGLIFSTVSCYFGIRATRSAEGVAKATNQAIVINATLIVVTNAFLTQWMYGG